MSDEEADNRKRRRDSKKKGSEKNQKRNALRAQMYSEKMGRK
jgi:hypothetical protein